MAFLTLEAQVSGNRKAVREVLYKERSKPGTRLELSKLTGINMDNWKSRWVASRKPECIHRNGKGTED